MTHSEAFRKRLLCGLFLGLALAVLGSTAHAQLLPPPLNAPVFSPPQNISNNPGASFDHQIAVDSNGKIYIVWLDNSPGYAAVFFSQSSNGGVTFSTPQNLSNDAGGSAAPRIAVDPVGNIDVVWAGLSGSRGGFFTQSIDGGTTFSAPVSIANNVSGTPVIALDTIGNIYASWVDSVSLNVSFSRSLDGGATFSTPMQLSNRPPISDVGISSLAADANGNIDLVWEDCTGYCQVWFNRSNDGGVTFSSPQSIAGTLEFPPLVSMALDSVGAIYVTYNTVPFGDIWLVSSKDGGATFSQTNVSSDQAPLPPRADPCCAQVVVDPGDNIDVVWEDNGALRDITFARSTDGGVSFSSTTISTTGVAPQIAMDSAGFISVVWAGPSPNSDTFYSRSTDNGITFSSPQNLSNNSRNSNGTTLEPGPLLALDRCGNINVVWLDDSPGNLDIFFRRGITSESVANGCILPIP
jgi:hypothetical protein